MKEVKFMIKVSVIIPVYNDAVYLEECLDSVINQNLQYVEIICINDGSTDKSNEILERYDRKYKNIVLIHQENSGAAKARNVGIDKARGQFICFMDGDDFYPSDDVLKELYDRAIANKVLICGGSMSLLRNGKVITKAKYEYFAFKVEEKVLYQDCQCISNFSRFLYNLEMIKKNNIYFPLYMCNEDLPFLLEAMVCAGSFYKIEKVVYRYRVKYKKKPFNIERTLDYLKGCLDMMRTSKKYLFEKVQKRILSSLVLLPIYKYIALGNMEVLNFVGQIHKNIILAGNENDGQKFLAPEQIKSVLKDSKKREEKFLELIHKFKDIVIYGEGYIAEVVIDYMQEFENVKIKYAVVSAGRAHQEKIKEILVKPIDEVESELDRENTLVLVATLSNVHNEIEKNLNQMQFKNRIFIDFYEFQCYPKALNREIYL
jgi:glycosyltransferase involved in cell wall biosynthesis